MRRKAQATERDWVDTIRTQAREAEVNPPEAISYFHFPRGRRLIGWVVERRGWFTYYVVAPIPGILKPGSFISHGPYRTRWGAERTRHTLPRYL
jgi:hypothetical protein